MNRNLKSRLLAGTAIAALVAAGLVYSEYGQAQVNGQQTTTSLSGTEYLQLLEPSSPLPVAISTYNAAVSPPFGPSYQFLTATYTLTSQTTAQQMLNVTTNGAIPVLGATAYHFACQFAMTTLANTGTYSFGFGTLSSATLTSIAYTAQAQKSAAIGTAATSQVTFNQAATAEALVATSTTTTGNFTVDGVMVVNHAGSIQPQLTQGTAAAAVVQIGSGCAFNSIGTAASYNASVGGWN